MVFADAATAGSDTAAGAAARKAGGGGAGFTSRVVALAAMRLVEWLDIKASERPRQVATVTLVRIFIIGVPAVSGRVAPESRGRTDEWVLCGRKLWRTLQNYPEGKLCNRCAESGRRKAVVNTASPGLAERADCENSVFPSHRAIFEDRSSAN